MTPTHGELATRVFMLATTAIIIGWDILAMIACGVDATISRELYRFTRNPAIGYALVFAFGGLVGHCWYQRCWLTRNPIGYALIFVLGYMAGRLWLHTCPE